MLVIPVCSLKSYHNHINIWWLMLVGNSSRREQIKLFATNQKGCATICLYRLSQTNLVWRNGFGSKHVTLENLLTKSAYLVSFLNCKRRKIIPPHGVDMIYIRKNFHETIVDWLSDGDSSVIEICIFFPILVFQMLKVSPTACLCVCVCVCLLSLSVFWLYLSVSVCLYMYMYL